MECSICYNEAGKCKIDGKRVCEECESLAKFIGIIKNEKMVQRRN